MIGMELQCLKMGLRAYLLLLSTFVQSAKFGDHAKQLACALGILVSSRAKVTSHLWLAKDCEEAMPVACSFWGPPSPPGMELQCLKMGLRAYLLLLSTFVQSAKFGDHAKHLACALGILVSSRAKVTSHL